MASKSVPSAVERFNDLCRRLNMDRETQETAWTSYERAKESFTLEGDDLHWLACALYVACRQALVRTVSGDQSRGNSVSLTQILRSTDLSLLQFFLKIDHWMDMLKIDPGFRERIDALQRKFEVANVIFQKYDLIFKHMFKSSAETSRPTKGRKNRSRQCSSGELYKFGWTLYVYTKGHFPLVNGDLVNSHHLLLCCMDMFYSNAVMHERRDLLNVEFAALELPNEAKRGEEFKPPEEPPCVMDYLCSKYNGIVREAKAVREHYWKPYMRELFEKRILKGEDAEHLSDILEMPHFTSNNKSISQEYDRFVLSEGEFDEHIFLGDEAHMQIGTPSKTSTAQNTPFEARSRVSRNLACHFEKASALAPATPLTGRMYLSEKGPHTTPVSSATEAITTLRRLLAGCNNKPSDRLSTILKLCGDDFDVQIEARVEDVSTKFEENYSRPFNEGMVDTASKFAHERLLLSTRLFYRMLELILVSEQKRLRDSFKTSARALLSKDDFNSSLFACCIEIVLFLYNSNQCFPWTIQVLNIHPYNFYKVIEVIIKEEPGLSRSVVKHLNQIEEKILDSLAWKSNSLLFQVLEAVKYRVPMFEEVTVSTAQLQASAPTHPVFNSSAFGDGLVPPCKDQYSSPMVARRQLGLPVVVPSPASPGQRRSAEKQKDLRSLKLFFRKVYHVAFVRMKHLCDRLAISDDDRQKMWTCFEHSLVHHPLLMKDRHLDQLIICAVYVMGKVLHNEISFQKIMEHYRYQPQARNHIYRSVLLSTPGRSKGKGKSVASDVDKKSSPQRGDCNSTSPSRNTRQSARRQKMSGGTATSQSDPYPTDAAGGGEEAVSSTTGAPVDPEERGDIVKFYNQVYVYQLKEFALKFSPDDSTAPPLSPVPVLKQQHQSPKRRISARHSLYLSPHRSVPTQDKGLTPTTKKVYCFSVSPSKKLQEINESIRNHSTTGIKRTLAFPDSASPAKRTPSASPLFSNSLRALSQDREDASNSNSRDSFTSC
ncbi:retinoblastoma-like protein 2 isoform X2 [Corticium candelabrum]|uniref:retinoblastoma-like protein 2 isoform X2 n=1 Tax=Corticium candelabrum TaxID=121492 RepID=UPI002E25FE17|nr:retinoblastoma-like protein 2 isoform X2 [Corticium candelabrum]